MVQILVLDDNEYRHKTLQPYFLHDKALTAQEAIDWLGKKNYKAVFLDHDLGGKEYVDASQEETGMTVVKYILDNDIYPDMIFVHSCNPYGAENMRSMLDAGGRNVECVPFIQLVPLLPHISRVLRTEDPVETGFHLNEIARISKES